jgi:uncharacterized protein YoxC
MKTVAPVIIGIVVFAAILVGWFFSLPGALKRAGKGSNGTLSGITLEAGRLFNDIKVAQTDINKGVATMNDVIVSAYNKEAAIQNLKTKIENEAKVKAALANAPAAAPVVPNPASAPKTNSTKPKIAKP